MEQPPKLAQSRALRRSRSLAYPTGARRRGANLRDTTEHETHDSGSRSLTSLAATEYFGGDSTFESALNGDQKVFFSPSTQGPNYGVAAAAASSRPRARRGSYFEDVATRRASREHWQTGPSSSGDNVMDGKQRGQWAQAAWHDTTTRAGRPYGTSRRPTNGTCEKVPLSDKPAAAPQQSNALFRLHRIPPEISPIGNK